MTTYAYLRVSTIEQDLNKNKAEILLYANEKLKTNVEFIEETVSGTSHYTKRELGQLINSLKFNDILIVPELSRLARSITQIFEIIEKLKSTKVTLISLKENFNSDDKGLTPTIISTIFGLVAQIERDLISQRTKEALQARKASGIKLGRPLGSFKSKLDIYKDEIEGLINIGVTKKRIAAKYDVTPQLLNSWVKRNISKSVNN